ncbi:MAG: imidazole glycerol phosphate synthase subunit HisH [Rhodospirillales bacterium]|jgi:glutamine amidotransferase|nr:imidazole glycerol phosphate synthase subunit HisH [Rhodospirillales bacterium]MDP6642595.1 imidazole glycerol phosphate synthase subunit HisH [Rhodospirillales bacterium]MDP6843745.1 imidazole glycerol phosphate synthase subunit HisH [Rhodospirillales bacterium]
MKAVIIDYGSGNLRSAEKASARAAGNHGGEVVVGNDPGLLQSASHIILPGVGAFRDCRLGLDAVDGMVDALEEQVIGRRKPFLGICVGMQLLATIGREHGDAEGLGWIPGEVAAIEPSDAALKIPHMGWNSLDFNPKAHPVLEDLSPGEFAYFVHSYGFRADAPADELARVDYGGPLTAIVGRDNIIGTQFHPEKSQRFGLAFLTAFFGWRP